MSYTETKNNKEILEHNLKVTDGDRQLWDYFLEQAAVKPLRWIPSANTQFNRIKSIKGLSSHKYVLYLFVDDQYFQKVFGKEMGMCYGK